MTNIAPADTDLRERLIWVVNEFVGTWKKYPYLEQRTGISARKWQNVCNRVQQPSVEMVAAMGEVMPHFLSWLITGHCLQSFQVDPSEPDWADKFRSHESSLLSEASRLIASHAELPAERPSTARKRSSKVGDLENTSKRPRRSR